VEPAFEEPSDRKRTKVLFCLLLGIAVVVLFIIYPREPSYNGVSISKWLDAGSHELKIDHVNIRSSSAGYAVEQIGTPAVPYLLKAMSSAESSEYQLQRWLNGSQSFVRFEFADKMFSRGRDAAMVFVALEEKGSSGFPVLTNWMLNPQFAKTDLPCFAIIALAGTEEGVHLLIREMAHTNRVQRFFAANALGQAQCQSKVANALMAGLADPEALVRFASARSLGKLRFMSEEVMQALIRSLTDSDVMVRQYSAFSLGRAGYPHPHVLQALMQATSDSEADVRFAAAWAIEDLQSGTESIQPLLLESLHISDSHKQWDTLVTLGYRGTTNEIIIAELKKMAANDPTSHVRATAQWALDTFSSRRRK
jgi:hypothetical protein